MAKTRIVIGPHDEEVYIEIILPDGREVSVCYTMPEDDDSFPEIDMELPNDMCMNCWAEGFNPAPATLSNHPHVRRGRKVCIPLEPSTDPLPVVPPLAKRSVAIMYDLATGGGEEIPTEEIRLALENVENYLG